LTVIGKVRGASLEDNIGMIEARRSRENDEGPWSLRPRRRSRDLKKEVARPRSSKRCCPARADRFDSYLEVHAGAGGTESQGLGPRCCLRMYTRWAEKHGLSRSSIWKKNPGRKKAGIKSATIQISGPQCLWLAEDRSRRASAWCGSSRRSIPMRADTPRSHPFAIFPVVDNSNQDRYRRGPTCRSRHDGVRAAPAASMSTRPNRRLRLTHIPTGVAVVCQAGRSQHKNKGAGPGTCCARAALRNRTEKSARSRAGRRSGRQDRYRLGPPDPFPMCCKPYQMVKDSAHRRADLGHLGRARRRSR